MSWLAGRFSISIFAVKSLSGSAAIGGSARASLNDSVVARPHHAAVDRDVARLHPMGDRGPIGRAREIGHRDGAEHTGAGGEETAAGEFDVHEGWLRTLRMWLDGIGALALRA